MVDQPSLVDVLLQRMEVDMEGLILAHNWAPEVEDLVHRVLLESCQADGLLENEWVVLEQLLTVVGGREELRNFGPTPDDESLFRVCFVVICHVLVVVFVLLHLVLSDLEVCKLA